MCGQSIVIEKIIGARNNAKAVFSCAPELNPHTVYYKKTRSWRGTLSLLAEPTQYMATTVVGAYP